MRPFSQLDEIKAKLENYLKDTDYAFNPDTEVVTRVLNGLAMRRTKTGKAYCPCRILSGDSKKDRDIICPCVFHKEEIEKDGICHCKLFVKIDYAKE